MSKKESIIPSDGDLFFAKRLREARECNGLKQSELASKAHITPATVSAYELFDENSTGKKPSLHNAIELAKALNVSLDWLCNLSTTISSPYSEIVNQIIRYKEQTANNDLFIDTITPHDTLRKSLPSYMQSCESAPIEPDEDIRDVVEEEMQLKSQKAVAITIKNPVLVTFFTDWNKIYRNYIDGIIDREIYDLWLDKRLKEINKQQFSQMD